MEKLHDNQVPLFVKCNGFVIILFQLANEKVTLSVDVPVLTQYVFVDSSIQDTRFSFTYSADVNVEVKMVDNSSDIIVSRLPTEKKVVAEINGTAVIMSFPTLIKKNSGQKKSAGNGRWYKGGHSPPPVLHLVIFSSHILSTGSGSGSGISNFLHFIIDCDPKNGT